MFTGPTRRPSILQVGVGTDVIVVGAMSGLRVNSPASSVGNRDPDKNNDHVDVSGVQAMTISIGNLPPFCSRISLKSGDVLLHILPVRRCTLQGKSNRLGNYKARCSVHNDSIKVKSLIGYIPPMCCFEFKREWGEELEHRNVVMMWIHFGNSLQVPVFERFRVKRIASL